MSTVIRLIALPVLIILAVIEILWHLAWALVVSVLLGAAAWWLFGPGSTVYPAPTVYSVLLLIASLAGLLGLWHWWSMARVTLTGLTRTPTRRRRRR